MLAGYGFELGHHGVKMRAHRARGGVRVSLFECVNDRAVLGVGRSLTLRIAHEQAHAVEVGARGFNRDSHSFVG
jgi:hypothetical protein